MSSVITRKWIHMLSSAAALLALAGFVMAQGSGGGGGSGAAGGAGVGGGASNGGGTGVGSHRANGNPAIQGGNTSPIRPDTVGGGGTITPPGAAAQPGGAVQQPGNGLPGTGGPAAGGSASSGVAGTPATDQFLAALLILKNRGEINMARMAVPHLSTPEARDLAQMFERDHTQFVDNIERLVGRATALRGSVQAMPGTEQRGGTRPPQSARQAEAIDPLKFVAEVVQRTGAIADRELSLHRGPENDESFLNAQEPMHVEMLATLSVAHDLASPRFQRVIDEGIETTKKHLEEIRTLKARLGFTVARRNGAPPSGATPPSGGISR